MAMSGSTMGAAVASAIQGLSEPQKQNVTLVWQTICAEIVAHIQANAQVAVASVSGVTPGGGASGPGTGTVS
jgi:hypothetical protein